MYPSEALLNSLTVQEVDIIRSIRIIIGDRKTTLIEESDSMSSCGQVMADGSIYKLGNKGWPKKVIVGGTEFSSPIDPQVENYEYLVFSGSGTLDPGITVIYETFRFGDMEILESFDYGASSVLPSQCKLLPGQLSPTIMNLAAGVVLLQGEFQKYAEEAVKMEDNNSIIDLTNRLQYLQKELTGLRSLLENAIKDHLCCATYSLPVIRVE